MIRKTILLISILFSGIAVSAQADSTAPYMKTRTIPDFSLLSVDSVVFTQSVIDEKKSTIFMLFHPDCDHCQKQLQELLTIPELATSTNIIMLSIETLQKNKTFYNTNHLEKYPFIHLGKDYKYFFGGFFRPTTVPVLVFYNKKRQFILINHGDTKKKMVLDAIKE